MKYDPQKHHRCSIRLRGFDYALTGAYFVTIVTLGRESLLGEIVNGEMRLNANGEIVYACWDDLPSHYANVELDKFVVMPNHVHGIIVLTGGDVGVGGRSQTCPLPNPPNPPPREITVMGYLKSYGRSNHFRRDG